MEGLFRRLLYYAGLTFITAWLFSIHTAFSYALNPISGNVFYENLFMVNGFDFKVFIPYIWGGTFSFAISAIIALLNKRDKYFWVFSSIVAGLELTGIALLNQPSHTGWWIAVSSVYYGIYTLVLITFYFYVKPKSRKDLKDAEREIDLEQYVKKDEVELNYFTKDYVKDKFMEKDVVYSSFTSNEILEAEFISRKNLEISYIEKHNADEFIEKSRLFLYIAKIYNDTEQFVKIGLSINPYSIYNLFKSKGYNADELFRFGFDFKTDAYNTERRFHEYFNAYQYAPKVSSYGFYECYDTSILDNLNGVILNNEINVKDKLKKDVGDERIVQLLMQGVKGSEIAKKFNVSEAKVSRIKSKIHQ
jgi:transcriptional regulator